jgi:hypothetical protein
VCLGRRRSPSSKTENKGVQRFWNHKNHTQILSLKRSQLNREMRRCLRERLAERYRTHSEFKFKVSFLEGRKEYPGKSNGAVC